MLKRDLLKRIYKESKAEKTLVFTHADKIWIMPESAVEGAMEMYQPSSKGGKRLKKCVVKKHKTPFYARGSKVEKTHLSLSSDIRKQIEDLIGINDFYVAAYMGDTSTSHNDKAVLQIYGDEEIYAYVKVTTDEDNAKRFDKEASELKKLQNLGIEYVPRVIGLSLDREVKMFAQVNEKPMGQDVKLEFNSQILDTVKDLVEKTTKDIEYKESDFCKYVENLKDNLGVFDKDQQSVLNDAIEMVETKDLKFAFSHGDYTPWNIYYVKDDVKLFDLEYCSETMPEYVDVFHYLSQTTLLGKRFTAQCVMREYEHNLKLISEYVDDPRTTFICYLVWVISFYIKRAEGNIDRIRETLDVWVEMLEYLIKYLK